MDAPWFESWFDSPYYPVLYAHRNDSEAEGFIRHLLDTLRPSPGSHFLDLACGRGRHSRFIHAQGFEVTGVDLSPASIADANKHASPGLHFFVQDMRDPFPGTYDYILNLFTSFGYFDDVSDNLKVLQNVSMSLKPGGIFVLDFLNVAKVAASLIPSEQKEINGIRFHLTRALEDGFIVKRIHVEDQGVHQDFVERVQALNLEEIESLMKRSGLTPVKIWGDYRGGGFSAESSDRLIVFAQST